MTAIPSYPLGTLFALSPEVAALHPGARLALLVRTDPPTVALLSTSPDPLDPTSFPPPLALLPFSHNLSPLPDPPLPPAAVAHLLRSAIADVVDAFDRANTAAQPPFIPGRTPIPPSGKIIGVSERQAMVEAALDGWLTAGRFNDAFERKLASYLGVRHVRTTVSGSSANLLALTALTSPKLGDRALKPGDEVITAAASFPTTVNPIWQNGLIPVFLDVTLPTYNIDTQQLEAAYSSRTRAVMIAHTLGNPFDLDAVLSFCRRHDLYLIEDCCDALGSTYRGRKVGTFGHLATFSFYPAHHITMGEGGAVATDDDQLAQILQSIRDWGRDCWCPPGRDNTCGRRFSWQLGHLPPGYDHKYTYSHLGYNLKITDLQAACGLAQLDRLDHFVAARRRNYTYLYQRLQPLADRLLLPEPTPGSDPSWFGFLLTLTPNAETSRADLLRWLESRGIGTRLLFAGNLLKQPYALDRPFRLVAPLVNTDRILHHTFWVGLWPGLTPPMLDYLATVLLEYFGHF
ncbi:MAG: lipopolysaccharide biosynthesis protein RfbH [Hydrogenophilus sp.]|nr:lipopolysaccharide biosynthesis protein RfbH [Hydrogenophilus sp.]